VGGGLPPSTTKVIPHLKNFKNNMKLAQVGVYTLFKILRRDFWYWMRVEGVLSIALAVIERTLVKVIFDFTGCAHFRHPFEMGGASYSLSMVWAQIMPFVALGWYEGENKEDMRLLLGVNFTFWVVLNGLFFLSIEKRFIRTFFTRTTAPLYTVQLFLTSEDDASKFDAAFDNRASYIGGCEGEVREWVRVNIERWREEKAGWFKIDKIPDAMLPAEVVVEEGGARRRRSSVLSVREIIDNA